jgi:hypothetical protein
MLLSAGGLAPPAVFSTPAFFPEQETSIVPAAMIAHM